MFCGRNRRSAQGDRLPAITMSLQPGSESDEDSILSGVQSFSLSLTYKDSLQSNIFPKVFNLFIFFTFQTVLCNYGHTYNQSFKLGNVISYCLLYLLLKALCAMMLGRWSLKVGTPD